MKRMMLVIGAAVMLASCGLESLFIPSEDEAAAAAEGSAGYFYHSGAIGDYLEEEAMEIEPEEGKLILKDNEGNELGEVHLIGGKYRKGRDNVTVTVRSLSYTYTDNKVLHLSEEGQVQIITQRERKGYTIRILK